MSAIGAGGMGEVYRARDTKLHREVALKVLRQAFTSDPDRLARFTREAHVLASLNHPHIAAIYGFEDSGERHALVLELVHGETLAERIARGPLPLDEALPIARQIGLALEAAHDQGIIHRDLKPSNIKISRDGVVKVLDFGLAKLAHPEPAGNANVSTSPTITSPALLTGAGVLLGTAAYMSPEQAKGRDADKRSDIWAFGCVVYEMLTGRRAFDGDDMTDVLGAVVRLEPNWLALPPDVPPPLRALLQQCLVKDRRSRIGDIAAALFVIDYQAALASGGAASTTPAAQRPLWQRTMTQAIGALLVAAAATMITWRATRPTPSPVVRTTIATSGSSVLALSGSDRDVAITPDGSRIVYRGNNQLLVRALNRLEPTVLGGLAAARGVFVSPDGEWIGYFDVNTVKKVPMTGGPPVTICAFSGAPRGASWSEDGTIIFATNSGSRGLLRVSAAGGEPKVITQLERTDTFHVWPEFLPGGQAVLFTVTSTSGSLEDAEIALLDLRTGTSKVLIRGGSHALYVPTGHLVYGAAGTLRAVGFDLTRLEVVGVPAPVLEGVVTTGPGVADFDVAANGSLVYVPGAAGVGGQQTIVAIDRQGRAQPLAGLSPDSYRDVKVSPDGDRLALATRSDVWTYDFARTTVSRLTTHPASETRPMWTPDGRRIIFTSNRAGYPELFWRLADGSGSDERLLARARELLDLRVNGWSPDGRRLLFAEVPSSFHCTIRQAAIERLSESTILMTSEFCPDWATVSPDGRWMAYHSRISGRPEVYVERYPELGSRQQISTGGGGKPVWSRAGRELFFSSLDNQQMFAVPVQTGLNLVAGKPQPLFEFPMFVTTGSRPYDVTRDGRFVMIRAGQPDAPSTTVNLIVVQNWFEELERLVPTR